MNSEGSTHLAEGGEAALLEGQQLGVCVPLQPVPAPLGPRHHHHLATCTQPDIIPSHTTTNISTFTILTLGVVPPLAADDGDHQGLFITVKFGQ